MKRVLLPLLAAALVVTSCASGAPALVRSGVLAPGGALIVRNIAGDVGAYAPEHSGPQNRYTVAMYGPSADAATVTARGLVVRATARRAGVRFLLRAPHGTSLDISCKDGNISVQDYDGVVNARTDRGDIKMLIPQYGNAFARKGNVSVIFASDSWNGTLHFGAGEGNVEIYVNEKARARVRMHTDDGTVYSDFNLRGTSRGTSETIDAPINGGGPRSIDVEVRRGSIRVMQLKPQL